jgi:hypothetical protein
MALKYVMRCVNESMRLYPHPPVLLRRALVEDELPGACWAYCLCMSAPCLLCLLCSAWRDRLAERLAVWVQSLSSLPAPLLS